MSISHIPGQALHAADPALALWNLLAGPTIDPVTLARAIESVTVEPNLDCRTLQLVKEGWEALEGNACSKDRRASSRAIKIGGRRSRIGTSSTVRTWVSNGRRFPRCPAPSIVRRYWHPTGDRSGIGGKGPTAGVGLHETGVGVPAGRLQRWQQTTMSRRGSRRRPASGG
jgi:hypothetical protein